MRKREIQASVHADGGADVWPSGVADGIEVAMTSLMALHLVAIMPYTKGAAMIQSVRSSPEQKAWAQDSDVPESESANCTCKL